MIRNTLGEGLFLLGDNDFIESSCCFWVETVDELFDGFNDLVVLFGTTDFGKYTYFLPDLSFSSEILLKIYSDTSFK